MSVPSVAEDVEDLRFIRDIHIFHQTVRMGWIALSDEARLRSPAAQDSIG